MLGPNRSNKSYYTKDWLVKHYGSINKILYQQNGRNDFWQHHQMKIKVN